MASGPRTETLVGTGNLCKGDVVETGPGTLDDGEPVFGDNVSIGGAHDGRGDGPANREHRGHTRRRDARYDDAAEALADLELSDEAKSGKLFPRASAGIAVIKVLWSVSGESYSGSTLTHTAAFMACGKP